MENYETIGIAVRQHDAIRFDVVRGKSPRTLFAAAGDVPRLFEGETISLFRLGFAGDAVMPVQAIGTCAHISQTGRMVLLWIGAECMGIPTRQLRVHYDRDLGETSKIVRKLEEGAPSPTTAAPAPRLAVV